MTARRLIDANEACFCFRLATVAGQARMWDRGLIASAQAAFLTALCLFAAAPATAADSAHAESFVPMPLQRVAISAMADPMGIWTPGEMTEDPKGSDIYAGALRRGNEKVIVSQRVSAACGSPSSCPVRVLLSAADGSRHVLLQQEEACAAPSYFALSSDLSALRACDQVLPLAASAGPGAAAGARR